jgi:hypothetical protein
MFPSWRLQLREARVALASGRVDEAGALLSAQPLCEFLPAKELARDVAATIVERARDRFAHGDSSAGWRDLALADRLSGERESTSELRREAADRALCEVESYLSACEPAAALARLVQLERRGVSDDRSRRLRQIAEEVRESDRFAKRGHFAEASAAAGRALALAQRRLPGASTMDELRERLSADSDRLAQRHAECQRLGAEMHAALASENWSGVLAAADALLAIAPQHVAAGQARRRAWRAVGMEVTLPHPGPRAGRLVSLDVAQQLNRQAGRMSPRSTHAATSEGDTVGGKTQSERGLLWIDAVGGYLVCLDDVVVLGQPSPGDHPSGGVQIAVPILADLSRRHATIRRDGGAYVLEPIQRVCVDGRPVDGPIVLTDNQLIQLGEAVRLRFTKPHALSSTARLVLESHHKTQPSADAVLLMADSIVLGPNRHCHVRCREWKHDVVVFRQGNQLYCRADRPLVLDGVACDGANELRPGARVEGEEFAFAWEIV